MQQSVDFLVIGGGLAGLTFALRAAKHGSVMVLTKGSREESASDKAQGGIASVVSDDDSFESHQNDTISSGAGLCDEDVVRMCIEAGPRHIEELVEIGVPFSRSDQGPNCDFDLGREGGHSKRRVLHAGDFTGHEIMRSLIAAADNEANIHTKKNHLAVNLILDTASGIKSGPCCRGIYVLNCENGAVETIQSNCTVLATGGAGKVYVYTSNPDMATGDGMAMAYRAGAEMANMEFVQFHPTCLFHPYAKSFLLSEALRGEGGVLRLANGNEFMSNYDSRASLATRDIVAKAIDFELKKRGDDYVLLDMTSIDADYLKKRFPNIYKKCLKLGFDLSLKPVPVVPAAHYFCGGVRTDNRGRTSVPGLYAAGEVACTGFHGANRLASNSLLEAVVFGQRAADDAISWIRQPLSFSVLTPGWDVGNAVDSDESVVVTQNWDEIRRFMWNYVGIVRSNKRLARAKRRIEMVQEEIQEYYWNFLLTPDLVELRNIAATAECVLYSAMSRTESRGLHYNIDYPDVDDANQRKNTIISRDQKNELQKSLKSLPYLWD